MLVVKLVKALTRIFWMFKRVRLNSRRIVARLLLIFKRIGSISMRIAHYMHVKMHLIKTNAVYYSFVKIAINFPRK